MFYPAQFEEAPEGGFVVTFRDIPEAITQGDTEAEAMEMAEDALLSSIEFYLEERRQVPAPSVAKAGDRPVHLPASAAAKVLLLNEQIAQGVSNAELARRLGTRPQEIQRITNLSHATKIDTIDRALRALGRELTLVAH
ncbi:type II toxin-antitoxin system HicB family antitoxin [Thauera butanivorans]|uniref:type II toxin-antitoxin system HicB family antitoxin n=1 Tax=Thauera butanivorans TaxID=86174 RepID=UPI0008389387|nr:type II toxin-antitoxin system HicB family antitoxin [Thauera butanivorans]